MKNRTFWQNMIMAVISLALSFILSPFLINLIQIFGFGDITPLVINLTILMIPGVLFFIIRSFVLRKYDKPMWIMLSVIYLVFMIVVLFLKGQGRGVNFDVRDFFDQWNNGSYERAYLIGNSLAFVPYPLLLHFWGLKTKPWRAFLLFLAIEGLQFALSVGAFDVYDLTSYTIGYLVGYMILILYMRIGVQSAYSIPGLIFSKVHDQN